MTGTASLRFLSYGVTGTLRWRGLSPDADWTAHFAALTPPGATLLPPGPDAAEPPGEQWSGTIVGEGAAYAFECSTSGGGRWEVGAVGDLDHLVESGMGLGVAEASTQAVFLHAGVVGTPAGALVLPGRSFAGKTTLVRALLSAGCSYLSDEYAVLSPDGVVHPYPRRLSVRVGTGRERPSAADLDAPLGQAMSVAAVVAVRHEPHASLTLTPLRQGDLTMMLVDNAVAARVQPRAVMRTCALVARTARGFTGVRGEAADAADSVLALAG